MTQEYYIGDKLLTYEDDELYSEIGERVGAAVAEALTEEPVMLCHGYEVDEAVMKLHATNLNFVTVESYSDFVWGYLDGFADVCDRRWGG